MVLFDLIMISLGVSMDAFSVAVCKGLSTSKISYKNALITGLFFGTFQALMPLIGYFLGTQFRDYITVIIPWVAFILLCIIGIKMIKESFEECKVDASFDFKTMTVLAIATSMDALAVGVTLACLKVNIIKSVIMIGMITFILSFIGVLIGNVFGSKFQSKAELFGGAVLIIIAFKILGKHIGLFI
ncbi:MAG: manganese efflux pump MntP family protein [Bacilli bacterium]|nr:manganese efflux pump MntP family protein [Bacilli bacterium]MDD4282733.1 manganese efflux pump MntP family protein [Bacilli bacterium]MDD4719002.1 manganese efflux pump MntP family protein [Bacilli bacterium]